MDKILGDLPVISKERALQLSPPTPRTYSESRLGWIERRERIQSLKMSRRVGEWEGRFRSLIEIPLIALSRLAGRG